jgi:predicted ABC-type ATPase
MDWANANPGFRAVQPFVQKYKRDPESMTDEDWDKLEGYYKKYGPGGTRRGMRSQRYVGPPNVGGKKMGEIILGRVKQEHRDKPAGERTHFAVAGAPGMGKSTLVDFLQKTGAIPKDDEAAHIDPDFVKQGLPGYAGGRGAGQVHMQSATSARRISEDAAKEGMDIITEGTGQRGGYYGDIKKQGYRNVGHWAFTSPDTAVSRLRAREQADGRRIDPQITGMVHQGTYGLVTSYLKNGTLDDFHLWDTDVEKGKDPKKIAEVVDGVLKVHDKEKFIKWADGGLGRSGTDNLSYWQRTFAKKQ